MASGTPIERLHNNLRMPVIIAPMFLISGPDLVVAAAEAGILGAFPAANARSVRDLEAWMRKIDVATTANDMPGHWAVNMIVHRSYERFEQELELVCEYKPSLIITSLGSPRNVIDNAHRIGSAVFADVISAEQARKALDSGADGLILVCAGAGGHTGKYSPFAFIEEVRQFWDGPLVAAGAISSARSIAAMLTLGADFAYMGTHFINARESLVDDDYRRMLIRARMEDIVTTAAVSGVSGNWLRESLEAAKFDFSRVESKQKIDFSDIQGDTKAWKNVWGAGQGVGATTAIRSTQEIVDRLCAEWKGISASVSGLGNWPATCEIRSALQR